MGFLKKLSKRIVYFFIFLLFGNLFKIILNKFKLYGNYLYSCFIKSSLCSLGETFLFEYPVIIKGGKHIEIGCQFSSRARLRIEAWDTFNSYKYNPKIRIGNNVIINFDCHIGAINFISIGNNVLIGSRVLITDHSHGEINFENLSIAPSLRPLHSKGSVIIEDNVWIGEGVVILPNVRIGKNSIVGANSVVNKTIPDNCVVGGIPARIIKTITC